MNDRDQATIRLVSVCVTVNAEEMRYLPIIIVNFRVREANTYQ